MAARIKTEEGILLRINRSIQVEGALLGLSGYEEGASRPVYKNVVRHARPSHLRLFVFHPSL